MRLNKRQLDFIEFLVSNPKVPDYVCADEYGIPRTTLHDWKYKPEFMARLDERLKEQWADARRMAQDTMEELARDGNYNATKYILDSQGYAAAQKLEVQSDLNINVNIVDD